ncbi:MAG: DUF167 domain-containing protein [archaeon]|nr:DUF167 domain-containing protein [archaeon]
MILHVKVKPNSKEEKIEKIAEGEYIIQIKEPAEDNRANTRLINLLAKEFGVFYKQIKIKNPTSRKKIVEISR